MSEYADYKQAKTSDSDCSSALQFSSYRQRLVSADYYLVDAARDFIYIASRRKWHGCSLVPRLSPRGRAWERGYGCLKSEARRYGICMTLLGSLDLNISDITGIDLEAAPCTACVTQDHADRELHGSLLTICNVPIIVDTEGRDLQNNW